MELRTFDLLWLPDPLDTCLRDDTLLDVREARLDLEGPALLQYTVGLGHCPTCNQWYGLYPVLQDILAEAGWAAADVDAFVVENEVVSTGVYTGASSLPWSEFGEHMSEMEKTQNRPTPTAEEVRTLDQTPTTWEVGQQPATWIGEEQEDLSLGFAAVVHGPNALRIYDLQEGRPLDAEQVAALVRRAAGTPQPPAEPGRPRTVRVQDEALAAGLKPLLSSIDVQIEVDTTPLVNEALHEMTEHLLGNHEPPLFEAINEETIRSFVDTAARFYEAEPWTRTESDRFLGIQIDENPWFFANVMGHLGENPGFCLFPDWLTVCRFIHNERPIFGPTASEGGLLKGPLEAAGAMEALSLDERHLLHPVDAHRLDQLGIGPAVEGQYPVARRFDAEKGPVAPHFDLDTYRRTMEALLLALERRHATPVTSIKTTLEIDGRSVSLRYPSDGTERPYHGPPGYRFCIHGHDSDSYTPSRIPEGSRLVIEAPATTLFKDVAKALRQFDDRISEATLSDWDICLWDDRGSRRNPSPRVADLPDVEDPDVEMGGPVFELTVERPLESAPDDIHVEHVSGG